jgi:acetate kinase
VLLAGVFVGSLSGAPDCARAPGLTALTGTGDVAALEVDESPKAQLALGIYCYRVAQAVAAMATALGGLDALVFTAGVGEHSAHVRAAVCRRLDFLGVEIDEQGGGDADREISAASSLSRVHVIAAREDVIVARAFRASAAREQSGNRSRE